MADREPGEYEGANGCLWRWEPAILSPGTYKLVVDGFTASLRCEDLRAAGQALIALADELETEYVELGEWARLVLRQGSPVAMQVRSAREHEDEWFDNPDDNINAEYLAAFKAGQERGL